MVDNLAFSYVLKTDDIKENYLFSELTCLSRHGSAYLQRFIFII